MILRRHLKPGTIFRYLGTHLGEWGWMHVHGPGVTGQRIEGRDTLRSNPAGRDYLDCEVEVYRKPLVPVRRLAAASKALQEALDDTKPD